MEPSKTYYIALLLDAEPVLVALSYGKQTRVERVKGMDHLNPFMAVEDLAKRGIVARTADKAEHAWARLIWRDRAHTNYGTLR